ncbi:MAG: HNH endonuclease [Actinomycetota bacterium]|nr:HNH endonuclease [Actinomycetota bacterium]
MEPLLLDPTDADTRVEFGMAEAEVAMRGQWRLSAAMFGAIDDTLHEAASHPEVFIDSANLRGDAVEFAVRAAVADLAVRLSLAEATIRGYGIAARNLRERMPRLWAHFTEGDVSTPNAREAAAIVADLYPALWGAFEERLLDSARTLAPARFRVKARSLAERLRAATAAERHLAAREQRAVWVEHGADGMSYLNVYLPSADLAMMQAKLDATAFDLAKNPDETRTMTQLRVDALVDLLVGEGSGGKVGVTIAVTVPVMTLLGCSTEPAVMEGIGPIDLDTARRLTAVAPSLTRLLTDPATNEIVAMDSKQYRPSAALRRFLAMSQHTCDFPGCGRRAEHCDLDHTVAWAAGGPTTAANLAYRCRKHHSMKHQTKWRVDKPPGAERATWTSPTGQVRHADPPPF